MKATQWFTLLGVVGLSVLARGAENGPAGANNLVTPQAQAEEKALSDINAPIADDGATALHQAAQLNRLEEVAALLARGANINAVDKIGLTPLHQAALAGHTAIVSLLLEHKANPKVKDVFGLTPLHCAAQYGHGATIAILVNYGAELESKTNTQGLTALHWAAFWGHTEGVKKLLSSGADINARDNTGNTPLTWAEAAGQYSMARLLARRGGQRHVHEKLYGLNSSWHMD
ncbi:MAG: ankyrin repeat domain-containing protein [Lentisphaerae bacterium]|nr:ankyrin repeat domain-containing protein [Lentisphaerota bacterium]